MESFPKKEIFRFYGFVSYKKDNSPRSIYEINTEELIKILDDFIKYKDYFENPPEEAYEMDNRDYSECRQAREIERLLYKHEVYDTQYPPKLEKMMGIYNRNTSAELSREELRLDEIFIILTLIHRQERWCGGAFYEAIKNKTFYRLLRRMEEIRNELL